MSEWGRDPGSTCGFVVGDIIDEWWWRIWVTFKVDLWFLVMDSKGFPMSEEAALLEDVELDSD